MAHGSYETSRDGYDSWLLAVACAREKLIRSHVILPDSSDPKELRWAKEGERPNNNLDTVREAK